MTLQFIVTAPIMLQPTAYNVADQLEQEDADSNESA